MTEPDDLLAKADTLMARHRLGQTGAEPNTEIPVLDEVVDPGAKRDEVPVLTELAVSPAADKVLGDEQAESLRASVLTQLRPAIDALIESRLKQGLEPLVEKIFNDLRRELQLIAGEILREAVDNAIEEQLHRRESSS